MRIRIHKRLSGSLPIGLLALIATGGFVCSPTKSVAVKDPAKPVVAQGPEDSTILPAFLDDLDQVRFWSDTPYTLSEIESLVQSKKIRLVLNREALSIKAVELGGPMEEIADKDPNAVTLVGTFQGIFGGTEWTPGDPNARMEETAPGVFEIVGKVPAGSHRYKITKGTSWDKNWGQGFKEGGTDIPLKVTSPGGMIIRFRIDFNNGVILDSLNNPKEISAPRSVPAKRSPSQEKGKIRGFALRLANRLKPSEVSQPLTLVWDGQPTRTVYAREVLSNPAFIYRGNDLGSQFSPTQTTFKVWSPVSTQVTLIVKRDPSISREDRAPMRREANGVWSLTVPGNLNGARYRYQFESYGKKRVAADIYSYASTNAKNAADLESVVVDLSTTNPSGWRSVPNPKHNGTTDAVLYEIHVRDFTVSEDSGVEPNKRGKYLGLAQAGAKRPDGGPAGLDYLKWLGVTDIHLLPIQNFNPSNSRTYNWGYETTLFNHPEEQYSTQPDNPAETIRETKSAVEALHQAGLRVVLDVVYNHTVPGYGRDSAFWETVPYYYFRTNLRGDVLNESGVGNALHDDRPMVRKYVIDSLEFWVNEYNVDGFRFDLLGMFTRETCTEIAKSLRAKRGDLVLYGEPWTGGGPTRFGKGAQRGTGFAVFNDNFRSAYRGELDGAGAGFAMGSKDTYGVKRGAVGSIEFGADGSGSNLSDFALNPTETVNYVSAHDNMTLLDKVALSLPSGFEALQKSSLRLSAAGVLLSQGIPFLEGGFELGRTKAGNHNSYNAGDEVNRFDWKRATEYLDVAAYVKGLIATRKAHPVFRLTSAEQVRKVVRFLPDAALPEGVVAYRLNGALVGDSWKDVLVIFNGNLSSTIMRVPTEFVGQPIAVQAASIGGVVRQEGPETRLPPLSARVIYRVD
jgi:pullulanase